MDATFGGGGHARLILDKLVDGRLIAFDQDDDAQRNIPDDNRLVFVNHNFSYLKNFLKYHDFLPVDGILADLGVSSHQIDEAGRGFSTRWEGPLDMRMNQRAETSAYDVVNGYHADKLADLFFTYGELRNARKIAAHIELQRGEKPVETTRQLAELLQPLAPKGREMKFLAQVFQALRIEVNGEMDALRAFLAQCPEVLRQNGRLVVISYHSLEDRMVKNFMKAGNMTGSITKDIFGNYDVPLKPLGKMQTASDAEISKNKRARSARLRIAKKT